MSRGMHVHSPSPCPEGRDFARSFIHSFIPQHSLNRYRGYTPRLAEAMLFAKLRQDGRGLRSKARGPEGMDLGPGSTPLSFRIVPSWSSASSPVNGSVLVPVSQNCFENG